MQKKVTNIASKKDRATRIREERKRLGYTQQDIADACGVHRVQWGRYERGDQGLDGEPLEKFGKKGANIAYILTGQRVESNVKMVGKFKEDKQNSDETILVANFRKLSDKQQKAVLAMVELFVED